jgi:hypothetical protein
MSRIVTGDEFYKAMRAVDEEIEYQNSLTRRTEDEAKDVPGFLTLLRRYLRKAEDAWADTRAELQKDGSMAVPEAEECLRKIAAIALRGMIYTHIRYRNGGGPHE